MHSLVNNNKYNIVRNFVLLMILLLIVIFCLYVVPHASTCNNIGVIDNSLCNTNEDCVNSYKINNQTCMALPKINGSNCDNSELCFNHTLCQPTCNICGSDSCNNPPKCVGPRSCCQGVCLVNDDCATKVPFLVDTFNFTCLLDAQNFNGTCFYQIFNTRVSTENECLDLINGSIKNCMYATTELSLSFDGFCFYYFKCAPPLTAMAPEMP